LQAAAVTSYALPKASVKGAPDLVNTAWSLAQKTCKESALISSLAADVERRLKMETCSPKEISVFAWAFAKLGSAILAKILEFDALQISSTRWAFAKLRCEDREVLERLRTAAIQHAHEFSARHISNMVWSCAT